jgi:hypothetical protein
VCRQWELEFVIKNIILLAYQIAHIATVVVTNSSGDSDSIIRSKHCLAVGSSDLLMCLTKYPLARSKTYSATVQSINECLQESCSPQIERELVLAICRWHRTSPNGRYSCASRHKNTYTTWQRPWDRRTNCIMWAKTCGPNQPPHTRKWFTDMAIPSGKWLAQIQTKLTIKLMLCPWILKIMAF